MRRLGIKRVGFEIGGQQAAIAVHNVGTGGGNRGTLCTGARLHRFGCGKHAHAHRNRQERGKEEHAQHQQAPFGAGTGAVAHLFVPLAQVFPLDGGCAFACVTGGQDTGKWAQRRTGHSLASSVPDTSTEFRIGGSSGAG